MEKQTYCFPILSLKEMTLRKSVVRVWTKRDILESIEKFPFKDFPRSRHLWQETVEDKVTDKIAKLTIPILLKSQMSLIVKPVGMQIVEWEKFISQCFFDRRYILDMLIFKQLSWTSAGAIDYAKTAANILRLETLDAETRFKIACEHCLIDSLPLVWQELAVEVKEKYKEKVFNRQSRFWDFEGQLLQIYWTSHLSGEEYKLCVSDSLFYNEALEFSARKGNKFATEYFFRKLSFEDRRRFFSNKFNQLLEASFDRLNRYVSYHKNTDVILYLYHQMNPELQMQFFRNHPGTIFQIFLNWRGHDLFLDKADLIWTLMPEGSTYDHLISGIRQKIANSYYYFPELIQEFFRRSPKAFRKSFVDESCIPNRYLFAKILEREDGETAKVILRNIDSEDRVRLVGCSSSVFVVLTRLIGTKGQHLVELCVREAFPSKGDRERLKECYKGFIQSSSKRWQQFFEYLDEADDVGHKQINSEEDNMTRAKRLCTRKESL